MPEHGVTVGLDVRIRRVGHRHRNHAHVGGTLPVVQIQRVILMFLVEVQPAEPLERATMVKAVEEGLGEEQKN